MVNLVKELLKEKNWFKILILEIHKTKCQSSPVLCTSYIFIFVSDLHIITCISTHERIQNHLTESLESVLQNMKMWAVWLRNTVLSKARTYTRHKNAGVLFPSEENRAKVDTGPKHNKIRIALETEILTQGHHKPNGERTCCT